MQEPPTTNPSMTAMNILRTIEGLAAPRACLVKLSLMATPSHGPRAGRPGHVPPGSLAGRHYVSRASAILRMRLLSSSESTISAAGAFILTSAGDVAPVSRLTASPWFMTQARQSAGMVHP